MRQISNKNKDSIKSDPFYKVCVRSNEGECQGKITIEHAIIFAGRQLDRLWSLIPLCEYHHAVNHHLDGPGLNKELNVWVALNRATNDELRAVSKAIDYIRERTRLNAKYGIYFFEKIIGEKLNSPINY